MTSLNTMNIFAVFKLLKHRRQACCQPFPEMRNPPEVCSSLQESSKFFPLIFYEQKLLLGLIWLLKYSLSLSYKYYQDLYFSECLFLEIFPLCILKSLQLPFKNMSFMILFTYIRVKQVHKILKNIYSNITFKYLHLLSQYAI